MELRSQANHRHSLHTEMARKVPAADGRACTQTLHIFIVRDPIGLRIAVESRTPATGDVRLPRAGERQTVVRSVHRTVNEVHELKTRTNAVRSGMTSHKGEIKFPRIDERSS